MKSLMLSWMLITNAIKSNDRDKRSKAKKTREHIKKVKLENSDFMAFVIINFTNKAIRQKQRIIRLIGRG
jgi:hypothetical protein